MFFSFLSIYLICTSNNNKKTTLFSFFSLFNTVVPEFWSQSKVAAFTHQWYDLLLFEAKRGKGTALAFKMAPVLDVVHTDYRLIICLWILTAALHTFLFVEQK